MFNLLKIIFISNTVLSSDLLRQQRGATNPTEKAQHVLNFTMHGPHVSTR